MTRKLFWEDPYIYEIEAMVIYKDGRDVVLDQSVLFAFSGGQESDSGTINDIPVVAAKDGEDIVYTLEKEPEFGIGDKVSVKIDNEKREKLMRLHTAAHVVFYLWEKKTGVTKLIGSNVTHEKARLDFEYPDNITAILPELEQQANELFSKDLPVGFRFDEARRSWVWNNGTYDVVYPCSGTHVKSTLEIGKVILKRKNIGAGKERIEIMLG